MTPRNEYLLMAFVWTAAIMTVALIIAYIPFIRGILWWVFGAANNPPW